MDSFDNTLKLEDQLKKEIEALEKCDNIFEDWEPNSKLQSDETKFSNVSFDLKELDSLHNYDFMLEDLKIEKKLSLTEKETNRLSDYNQKVTSLQKKENFTKENKKTQRIDKFMTKVSRRNVLKSLQPHVPFSYETKGHWIFPINYPERKYQFDIIESCLLKNTFVSLPTGLGKTFIAAVVMLNYHRWFPDGFVIFMAPTRPLVSQQIEACYNIAGISKEVTVEMTGHYSQSIRDQKWKNSSVIFLTPQVFLNDLKRGIAEAQRLVCLIIDEAHKSTGNHAYAEVIRFLRSQDARYRLVALSATPADSFSAVQTVVENLEIAHLELREENDSDILPYVYGRHADVIIVDNGIDIQYFKDRLGVVLEKSLLILVNFGVYWEKSAARASKYLLITARSKFQQAIKIEPHNSANIIFCHFSLSICLTHSYQILERNGIVLFYNHLINLLENGSKATKKILEKDMDFKLLLYELKNKVSITNEASEKVHPKSLKLKEIILKHFNENQYENTRVIVFSHFRESVLEIVEFLNRSDGIKANAFIGQSGHNGIKGLKQKEQLKIIQEFKKGNCNVLVATCIGEEGLDIGVLDICKVFEMN